MKVYYFDLYGRAEPIRLLLTHAKAEFEDVRLTGESWQEFKADSEKCKYGQVPVFEKDGKFYPQGGAILRYLGGVHGYYPEDVEARFTVDEITNLLDSDFLPKIGETIFYSKSDEERKEGFAKLVEEHYPKFFGFLEKQLTSNSSQEFMVGDSYTIADFVAIAAYISHVQHPHRKDQIEPLLDTTPTLKAYFDTRAADFKDYINNLPECSI
ncbi:unnamed protein product [Moneuplotes crassus]|uniref:Glutathione S-transferase n=1 Tax=Euplotes crassus TaxID=5936 RepID=A0AAD1XR21_EUPCR|nr:unnamed protein product [Moneuplotes crassus]